MDRRQDTPIPGNVAHFTGNNRAPSKRHAPVRSKGPRPEAPHLKLLEGGGEAAAPELRSAGYRAPVRAGAPMRPEWLEPLPPTLVDLPSPEGPADHLEAAIDLLRRAAQASSVSERGDALLVAIEHAARSLGELFDREAARKHLRDVSDGL